MDLTSRTPNKVGVFYPLIGIVAASLVFHLHHDSQLPAIVLLFLSSLLACREIFSEVNSPFNSAIGNGNVWALVSLLLIFVLSPTIRFITKTQLPLVFASRDTETNINQVYCLASVAIFSVVLGNRVLLNKPNRTQAAQNILIHRGGRPSMTLSIFVVTFWLLLYVYWAISKGNPIIAIFGSRNSQQAVGIIKSNGYLVDSLYGALGVLTAWLAYAVGCSNKRLIFKISLSCLLFVIPSFLQGDRSKFIYHLIVIAIILTSSSKKIKRRYLLVALFLVPILIVAPRVYRQSNADIANIGSSAFSINNITETFTKEDTAMAPALSILLNNLSTNIRYQYGLSYLNLVAKPIPRALWPGKPLEFDTQMMRVLFPKYAAAGVGFAFSAISEPLVNFGIFGVISFFFVLGLINRKMFGIMIQGSSAKSIFVNAWIAGFMFVLIRGNLSVDFQRALFPLISGFAVLHFQRNRDLV